MIFMISPKKVVNAYAYRFLPKTLLAFVAATFAVIAALPATAQTGFESADPETVTAPIQGPISNDEFRALAGAQLSAIAFMCNHYLMHEGEYPPTFYDLIGSNYWLAEMNNLFTGNALDPVDFFPRPTDFIADTGAFFDSGGAGGGSTQSGGGQGQDTPPPDYSGAIMPVSYSLTMRLDAKKIGPFEPGNVLFYSIKDQSLQMIIWMSADVFIEHFQTSPYDNSITRHQLGRKTHQTDDIVLASAVLIEYVIPRAYGKLQFARDENPLLPRDLPNLTWAQRENMFEELRIFPRSPITHMLLEPVKSFRVGMIADLGDGAVPPVYCMEGGRLRTLKEMTDLRYLSANQNEVKKREAAFGVTR